MLRGHKRARDEVDSVSAGDAVSDTDVDVFDALTGTKNDAGGNSDDELESFIHDSIVKRNVKGGAKVLKKTKGNTKMVKGEVGGGSFQSMGLHPSLLRSLTLQGYRMPTPIQRLSIPSLLKNPPRDLVGMARTGSGKSLAYLIPLVQRLGGQHSTVFGARSLVLLPTRELALQILKVGKELTRGWQSGQSAHAGDGNDNPGDSKSGQSLRWGLVVGGEGLDEQFEMIANNPDIIIATPGRLLHLIVEMNLDLKSVQYVVFDEADRLFEMGFETPLNEILHRLSPSRQTLLFSATLPKSLVEFAKAGLRDPTLVRLDAEMKISSDLKMAFFSVKKAEKDACLLALLRDVINVPSGLSTSQPDPDAATPQKSTKTKGKTREPLTAPHQTLIFAATKHHVEYLTHLLTTAGYSVSHIYGSLDQHARKVQMDQFRRGVTSILVVTDVAARGIDIPVLENVVNYDFPQGARVFVHRVGRTARAGRQGWAWSFVTHSEMPYLLDLQLFLGRPLKSEIPPGDGVQVYTESLVLGSFERETIDQVVEYVRSLTDVNHSLVALKEVMNRGHGVYERSRGKASLASYKRAKEMAKDPKWNLAESSSGAGVHPVFLRGRSGEGGRGGEEKRKQLLEKIGGFRPAETVFEAGSKSNHAANAVLMKERRKALERAAKRAAVSAPALNDDGGGEEDDNGRDAPDMEMADEDTIAAVFNVSTKKSARDSYRDSEFYISHFQKDATTEKGYSLTDGASFAEQAQRATFDLTTDELSSQLKKQRQLNWDKKKKKFIKGDGAGADNVKLVRTENGTKLPATYRNGRFDEWKKKSRVGLPRVGEKEDGGGARRGAVGGRRFRHNKITPAQPLDKRRTDYEQRAKRLKKREEGVAGDGDGKSSSAVPVKKGRYGGKPIGRVKSELKTNEQIRKGRKMMEKRKAKNARPKRTKKGRR